MFRLSQKMTRFLWGSLALIVCLSGLSASMGWAACQCEPHAYAAPQIKTNADARRMCPELCQTIDKQWHGLWNKNEIAGMPACSCGCPDATYKGGSIANIQAARDQCPGVCRKVDKKWNGQWVRSKPKSEATCGCTCDSMSAVNL